MNRRPQVALIATTYFAGSHADVLGTRLIEGYEWQGRHVEPRVEVASLYLEQLGGDDDLPISRTDIGVGIAERNGIPRFPTVAEAMTLGGSGIAVDGVVVIGEHGDYPDNEYGQKLYPRRRLIDSAISAMIAGGRTVPLFNDKHLCTDSRDSAAICATARRLGIPMLGGSTVPLTWRRPTGAQWPLGAQMDEIVVVGFGPREMYGFHNLEGLQVHAERRRGGETGVASVRMMTGAAAAELLASGAVNRTLVYRALSHFGLSEDENRAALAAPQDVTLIDYRDGLRAAVVNVGEAIDNFAAAATGPGVDFDCLMWLSGPPHAHFIFLARQVEALVLGGASPYPIERTLLTSTMLDAAMRSQAAGGVVVEDPLLTVCYEPPVTVADCGVELPMPD